MKLSLSRHGLILALAFQLVACRPSALTQADEALRNKDYPTALVQLDSAPVEGAYAAERDRLVLDALQGLLSEGNGGAVLAYFRNDRRSGVAARTQIEGLATKAEEMQIKERLAAGDWPAVLSMADDSRPPDLT